MKLGIERKKKENVYRTDDYSLDSSEVRRFLRRARTQARGRQRKHKLDSLDIDCRRQYKIAPPGKF